MTRSTTSFDSGDIVLVRIAFTDLSGAKVRPALVLSTAAYAARLGDLIVMPLTSQPQPDGQLALREWATAGLLRPTWAKPLIAAVAGRDVARRLGILEPADAVAIRRAIRSMIDGRWLA